jgi:acylphosphatase
MTSEQTQRTAYDVVVHGEVQGVFFRDSCRSEAQSAGVHGWVRNEYDGSVRAHVEGSSEAVETLLSWMRKGPRQARVHHVDVEPTEPEGRSGFEVR